MFRSIRKQKTENYDVIDSVLKGWRGRYTMAILDKLGTDSLRPLQADGNKVFTASKIRKEGTPNGQPARY